VAPLYARFGYRQLATPYGRVPLSAAPAALQAETGGSAAGESSLPAGYTLRRACFPADAAGMAALYEPSQAALGAQGYVPRDGEYWAKWLPYATGGNEWVLVQDSDGSGGNGEVGGAGAGRIIAFAQAGRREGVLKLQDFAADPSACGQPLALAFAAAVARCFLQQEKDAVAAAVASGAQPRAPTPPPAPELVDDSTLVAPVLLLRWLAAAHSEPLPALTDDRWMARPVAGALGGEDAVGALEAASKAGTFHLWDVDWF
jgi:hypothetical protein